jgi:hypothetical protein
MGFSGGDFPGDLVFRALLELPASNLSASQSRIHSLVQPGDRRYAVSNDTGSNDEAKLAVFGAREARSVFGNKFPECHEVEGLGGQELIYNFFVSFFVAHNSPTPE